MEEKSEVPSSGGNKRRKVAEGDRLHADGNVHGDRDDYLLKLLEKIMKDSEPFYDPDENALGFLQKSRYLILPADLELPICPASAIGLEIKEFKLSEFHIAAIYTMAKEQALSFGWDNVKAVRWACIRLESIKAGWYAGQTLILRKPAPKEAVNAFQADASEIAKQFQGASKLCGFIPFVVEVYFRQFNSSFKGSPAGEFATVVEKLARSINYSDVINYMDETALYGEVFRWIDIKRPKEAITEAGAQTKIPNIFLTRKVTVAGQALIITADAIIVQMKASVITSDAAIKQMMGVNWWDGVAKAGGYEEGKLVALAEKIRANPWKYHLRSSVYGEAPLSSDEVKEVDEAKALAIRCAPVLQAFVDVKLKNSSLANAKVLAKHAKSGGKDVLYMRAKDLFKRVARNCSKKV